MTNSGMIDEEIDHLMTMCTYISQMASRIRLRYLSNPTFPREHLKFCHEELLSMSEQVEGSAVLLEGLLTVEKRKPMKKIRYAYTREELWNKRKNVTTNLSNTTKQILLNVIERESQHAMENKNRSWRDIRTILA